MEVVHPKYPFFCRIPTMSELPIELPKLETYYLKRQDVYLGEYSGPEEMRWREPQQVSTFRELFETYWPGKSKVSPPEMRQAGTAFLETVLSLTDFARNGMTFASDYPELGFPEINEAAVALCCPFFCQTVSWCETAGWVRGGVFAENGDLCGAYAEDYIAGAGEETGLERDEDLFSDEEDTLSDDCSSDGSSDEGLK
jgi:hypothetical protein